MADAGDGALRRVPGSGEGRLAGAGLERELAGEGRRAGPLAPCEVGADRDREAGDAGRQERRPRADRLAEPAGDRPADDGRAEEDDRVDGHHPAAHLRLGGELQARVDPRRERDRTDPERTEREHLERQGGGEGGERGGYAEADGGERDQLAANPGPGADRQRAGDRADAHRDHQERIGGDVAGEDAVGEERDHDLEVEADRREDEHQQQRHPELATAGDVAERFADVAAGLAPVRVMELGRIHLHQRDEHRHERERVDAETGRDSPEGDDHARDRRARDPGRVDEDRVEADGVDDPVGADDLDHERLPGGVVDRQDEAAKGDHDEHHPRLDDAEGREQEEDRRRDRHPGLGDDQQLALVEAVGERAAERAEEEDARELQGGGEADGEAGAGQGEDEPELGDDLHPVAGQGDDLPGEVEAVVAEL